jgi:flavin-dependent dehydrogenase
MVGDAGMFVNSVHREGSNLAMTTGRLAAETLIELRAAGKDFTAANLARYRSKLDDSFVMKDLKKYRDMPGCSKRIRSSSRNIRNSSIAPRTRCCSSTARTRRARSATFVKISSASGRGAV